MNVYTNILYIKRKSKPLGTKFKGFVDSILNIVCWQEIQERKKRMKTKEFRQLGTTAACVRRSVDAAVKFETVRSHKSRNKIKNGNSERERESWEFENINNALTDLRRRNGQGAQPGPSKAVPEPPGQTVSNCVCIYYYKHT